MREQNRHRLSSRRTRPALPLAIVLMFMLALLAACGAQPSAPAASSPTAAPSEPATTAQATAAATAAPTEAAQAAPTEAAEVAATAPAPAAGQTVVRWLMYYEDVANDKSWQQELELFSAAHPDLKLEVIGTSWNDFTPKLQAMIAAGTPPDLVTLQNEAEFVAKGFVLPLDDLIQQDKLDTSRFVPGALEPAYDGKIYGFRHDTAYWMLYYNKDLFDAAGVPYPPAEGWTLDEFMETACKLSKPDEGLWGMHNLNWLTGILAQQQGLPYLEMVDGVPQYQIDAPQTIAFYQRIADFINKDNCQPNSDQSASLGGADPFIAGKTAMSFNGNWAFSGMKENAQFNYAVAPLPGLKQPNVGMKIGIAKTSTNQAAAWTALKWLTYEPEATRHRARVGMGQPAINDEEANQAFLHGPAAPEGLEAVFEVLSEPENSFKLLDAPGLAEANNIINPVVDEVMAGQAQAADVIPPAVQQANPVLAEAFKKATGGP